MSPIDPLFPQPASDGHAKLLRVSCGPASDAPREFDPMYGRAPREVFTDPSSSRSCINPASDRSVLRSGPP
jgi:hypothetical protein